MNEFGLNGGKHSLTLVRRAFTFNKFMISSVWKDKDGIFSPITMVAVL